MCPNPCQKKKKSLVKNKTSSHCLQCNIPLDQSLFLDFHYNFWLVLLLPSKLASVCSKHNKGSNCCIGVRSWHFFSPQSPPCFEWVMTWRSRMISSLVSIFDLVSYDLSLYLLASTTLVFLDVLELVRRVSVAEPLHILLLHLGWLFCEYLEGFMACCFTQILFTLIQCTLCLPSFRKKKKSNILYPPHLLYLYFIFTFHSFFNHTILHTI